MMINMNQEEIKKEDVWLVYDGECPACKTYCKYIRIREAVGNLRLVDGGLIGAVTVSGLPQEMDHQLAVDALREQ
ncbi:MAG: heme-binding protein [Cellvibrio sp.]|uniref:heme-binding protein n=1 Tax=Cellvibrio sp. TaxID=1965322 RepID=UPI00272071DF|nr:heme-binding protein [Cellvibrio sp.]